MFHFLHYRFKYLQIYGSRWDAHEEVGFCSESVEIVFRAIYHTSNLLGAKAAAVQNRSIIHHIAELVTLFRSISSSSYSKRLMVIDLADA